ncbi:FtsH protease activity modulator HflK [Piscirickettsia litoralis]|uniref:Protein HflK n=1 Tax=Piscirickettsia litoralis TaxID=1891921 RepID=A0ABX3A3R0_9GAMM|nr:FtsH protease activity modulator HflK [Piscirickettsia litoralis]ODN42070.1 HflK protein [Piscirickettsia litoralis]
MAWNEPGQNNNKDPWGNNKNNKRDDGPPDLDAVLRKITGSLRRALGLGGGNGGSSSSSGGGSSKGGMILATVAGVILLGLWAASGFFVVQPAQEGAILRFGKFIETVGPGMHWIPTFIDSRKVVNVDRVMSFKTSGQMLTSGENIVFVDVAVQYKIDTTPGSNGLRDFLFKVDDPVGTLREVTDSAVRQVIGESDLDEVLTTGREKIRQEIKQQIISTLKPFQTGLEVTDIAMQPAKAPEEVKSAFDDVIKAREDKVRVIDLANAYANKIVPIAQGKGARLEAEAKAYKTKVTDDARGQVARFNAYLPDYKANPKLLKERLYLQYMEGILGKNQKVVMDTKGGNNLFYLPLGEMLGGKNVTSFNPATLQNQVNNSQQSTTSSSNNRSSAANNQRTAYLRWQGAQ